MTFSIEDLKEKIFYNPDTGEFLWKVAAKGHSAGVPVGTIRSDGYLQIRRPKEFFMTSETFALLGLWLILVIALGILTGQLIHRGMED